MHLQPDFFYPVTTIFEHRSTDLVVVKLSYSTKLEAFVEKFGDYKDDT